MTMSKRRKKQTETKAEKTEEKKHEEKVSHPVSHKKTEKKPNIYHLVLFDSEYYLTGRWRDTVKTSPPWHRFGKLGNLRASWEASGYRFGKL